MYYCLSGDEKKSRTCKRPGKASDSARSFLNDIMIIIITRTVKRLTQILYDKIIDALDLYQLECPCCGHSGCTVHAYYERIVKSPTGSFKLLVLRVKCPACGKTHAILPDSIVPYSSVSMEDTVEIILADTPEMVNSIFWDNPSLNLSDIRRIQRNFKIFWKERLESFRLEVLPGLSEHCIQLFRRQFMQIRCTLCGSFICDHTG